MLLEEDREVAPDSLILSKTLPEHPDLFDFHPIEIARQMTLIDSVMLKKIKLKEYFGQGWMKHKSPNIEILIARFNKMSCWVSSLIVLSDSKELRTMIITQFALIALECLQLNNFMGVLAIISGLTSAPISRLVQTWLDIDSATIKHLEKLKEIVSPANKF